MKNGGQTRGDRYRRLMLGGVALSLMMPAAAFAQSSADSDFATSDGNEIIVTATKRERTLQDVPVAVSVTTADTIERAHIRDISDLVSVVPSLRVVQLQGSQQTNFFIRGFGNGSNNVGIEPSVGVFVDGVFRSRTASQISDFPDIQRIEVLRGPQSTLFGKNASAGVISIVSREPQFTFGGSLEASYGNYDARVIKGYVTGPVSDKIALSLAAGVNKRDGYTKDLGSDTRENERNRWFVRGQALLEPSDALKIRIIGDYDKIDENCCTVVNIFSSSATAALMSPYVGGMVNAPQDRFKNQVYYNFPSTNKIENYGVSGQIDYDAGPFKLTSITALRRTNALNDQDSDFTSARLLSTNLEDKWLRSFTQEFRVSADINDRISALFGVFYLNEKFRQHGELYLDDQFRPYANLLIQGASGGALNVGTLEGAFGALDGDPAKYLGKFFQTGTGQNIDLSMRNQSFSVFGQFDVKLAKRLTLTLGGNYTRDKKKFATDVSSYDQFSAIDFDAAQYAPLRYNLIYQGALNGGLAAAQAAAYATANMNNPRANPLGALRTLQLFPQFVNVPNAAEDGKTSDGNFSYTVRLAYDASDHLNLYASYATGFKASSINLSRDSRPPLSAASGLAAAGLLVPNLQYGSRVADPEKARVMELGAKGNWSKYAANLAVFYQEIKGFQSNIFLGTGFALSNAGKQSTYGVEFEGTARPIRPLTLGVSVTWLDPKYNSFIASAVGDQSGRRPPEIPKWSTTFSAQWDQELGNGDRMILRGSYHYESTAWAVEGLPGYIQRDKAGNVVSYAPAIEMASHFKRQVDEVDASLTYAMKNGLELSVWGRNLLNDRYFSRIFDSVAQPLAVSGYLNQPRTYGVSANFKW